MMHFHCHPLQRQSNNTDKANESEYDCILSDNDLFDVHSDSSASIAESKRNIKKTIILKAAISSIVSIVVIAVITSLLLYTGYGRYIARAIFDTPQGDMIAPYPAIGPFYKEVEGPIMTDPHKVDNPDDLRRSIDVNGTVLRITDSFRTAKPPTYGAGLWAGSDSTTDNSWGYFIGHNPGDFRCALTIQVGDPVTVYDADGNAYRYFAQDIFIVPNGTTWSAVEDRVTGHGESAILQTCLDDSSGYRITVCY